ncbi:MAG: GPI inositol deacylase [Heterodermia speciosa]|uniref:GPI inositol-deacylase n=1 Tax=Heterodermia speciosa TaxID=116794 RepID=A0A8H3IUU0_9LECA|nr:MAG: GPI inositol deacylase [Heterodermia speciosa]
MRRRSFDADERDFIESRTTEPPATGHDDKRNSFTSAKFDLNRHSDTLDRRKIDKIPTVVKSGSNGWKPSPGLSVEDAKTAATLVSEPSEVDNMPGQRGLRLLRSKSPWSCTLLTLTCTFIAISLLLSIIHSFATRQLDPKGCHMYYSRSIFTQFADFDTEHTRFASKYSLYLYREGGFDEDPEVKGVPVLFIPGNAGSYKQVRSLASESAQYYYNVIAQDPKALEDGATSIDFFSVDFNEDFTAFHGQTLLDQAEYLNDAIAYILSLYHDSRRSQRNPALPDPSSVILIGHSMGGVVARTMLTMPNYQSNSVNTIVTMSTPHARPPVAFDGDIVRTYKKTNDYWREAYSQKWANDNPLWHVTLISIAGGSLDTVVPSDYASLESLVPATHGFTVFTSSVPNAWTGADHLQMVWCAQLVKPIVRSILHTVDVHRPSQTKPRAERMRIFKKWLLTGMETTAEKTLQQKEPSTLLTLEDNANSIVLPGQRLVLRDLGATTKPKANLLPIPPQGTPGSKKFTLLSNQAINQSESNGPLAVLFCSVFPLAAGQSATLFSMDLDLSDGTSGSTRLACKNAASDVILLPASTRHSVHPFDGTQPFSYLQYELEDLADHQFVAVVDKPTSYSEGWVIAEFSDSIHSSIESMMGLQRLLTFGSRFRLPADRPTSMNIHIPALDSSLLTFRVKLGKQACGDQAELFTPLMRQYLSEPHESKFFVNVKEADLSLHGVAPFMPPPLRYQARNNGVSLQLWSDPTCDSSLDVTLKVDLLGTLGKLVMRYRLVMVAFPLLVVAMVLRKQFQIYDENGFFISFAEAMDLCLRTSLPILLLVLTFLAIAFSIASSAPPHSNFLLWRSNATETAVDFTKNDLLLGSQDPIFWFLVPLSGLISAGVCVLLNTAALGLTYFLSILYSLLTSKENKYSYSHRQLSQTADHDNEYLVVRSGAHFDFYNYVNSILVLMLWVLPINGPVLVVWVHNLAVHWLTPFSSHHNVLSIMPFILLVETLAGGKMIPRVTSSFRYITNILFFILAVYAALYGITYAYLLHHFVNVVAAWLVAVHFSGHNFSLSNLIQILEVSDSEGDVKKQP